MTMAANSTCAPYPSIPIVHFAVTPCFSFPILALFLFVLAAVHAIVYLNTEKRSSGNNTAIHHQRALLAPTVWPQALAVVLQTALLVLVLVVDTHTTFACVSALCMLLALAINLVCFYNVSVTHGHHPLQHNHPHHRPLQRMPMHAVPSHHGPPPPQPPLLWLQSTNPT